MFLLASLLLSAPAAGPVADDRVVPIVAFEATTQADGEGGWTPVAIDGAAGGTPWERARARFELGADPEAGDWMLCVGGPGLDVTATLNGQPLERVADALAGDPMLAAGPRFTVSSFAFRAGGNVLDLAFVGARRGRGLERGPAYLLSRAPAARLRIAAAVGDLTAAIANFAALTTSAQSQLLLDRVVFKFAADGSEPRLAGQVDCAVVGSGGGDEIPMRELAQRKLGGIFPTLSLQLEDPRLPEFHARVMASAPVLTTPLRLSDAKVVTLDINQSNLRQSFETTWRLRFFPAIGGKLRVVHGENFVLLRNDVVGFYAENGKVLGSDEAPTGVAIVLSSAKRPGTLQTLGGETLRCGVVGFEPDGDDPSQADSMEELVESVLGHERAGREATGLLSSTIAIEPISGNVAAGRASHASAVATLVGMRRRGSRYVYAPAAGAQSAEAFFADTFTMFHFPTHDRGAVEWLLSTQDAQGAVRGDLPDDATPAEVAGADAYTVLRACRWFRWTYDGDHFLAMAPKLARALAHADTIDLQASPAAPAGRERLSVASLALARAAAHRELAEALARLSGFDDVVAASTAAATAQLEAVLRPQEQGGLATASGFVEREGEDPRDAAIALIWKLTDGPKSADLARQIGRIEPGAALDWRDALVARALLQSGYVNSLRRRFDLLDLAARTGATTSTVAAYHGALCFGMLRIRRDDLGTLEIAPQLEERQFLRTAIRIPEGPIRVQILTPVTWTERQLIVANESTLDLMLVIDTPSSAGPGPRVTIGELTYAPHEKVLASGESWRDVFR